MQQVGSSSSHSPLDSAGHLSSSGFQSSGSHVENNVHPVNNSSAASSNVYKFNGHQHQEGRQAHVKISDVRSEHVVGHEPSTHQTQQHQLPETTQHVISNQADLLLNTVENTHSAHLVKSFTDLNISGQCSPKPVLPPKPDVKPKPSQVSSKSDVSQSSQESVGSMKENSIQLTASNFQALSNSPKNTKEEISLEKIMAMSNKKKRESLQKF